ncbi:MAG: hypothetical protein AAFY64_02435, partial [Pseudomonadota bacterium]
MSGTNGSNGNGNTRDGGQPAGCSASELKVLIEKLADRIAVSDESNSAALQSIHTQLNALSAQSRSARSTVPPALAGAFDRLDDAIVDLAARVSSAGAGAERVTEHVAFGAPTADPDDGTIEPQHDADDASQAVRDGALRSIDDIVSAREEAPSEPIASAEPQTSPMPTDDAFVADPDMSWSEDSAEALTRIYESSVPEIAPQLLMSDAEVVNARGTFQPVKTEASAAAIDAVQATAPAASEAPAETSAPAHEPVDKPWLETRLSDIAAQLSDTLDTSDAEISFAEISRRLEMLEGRFENALNDVATRSDVEGLASIEQYLTNLSDKFERSRLELDRVALIEQEVMGLASRLSEDRVTA